MWQKLLGFEGPFPLETIAAQEVAYYISVKNAYGTPLDLRHTYVKLDWLSWAANLALNDTDFHSLMDPIFTEANSTSSRVPLTDLFDTGGG